MTPSRRAAETLDLMRHGSNEALDSVLRSLSRASKTKGSGSWEEAIAIVSRLKTAFNDSIDRPWS